MSGVPPSLFKPSSALADVAPPVHQKILGLAGMGSPIGRFVGVTALVGAITYATAPAPFFEGGQARPWALLTAGKASRGGVSPTLVPWYVPALLAGFLAATFL